MVGDWWQSFGAGDDALMVAKRNAEVEKLNELAREVMRAEGRLGAVEIEVGEARFAAGDQVITRINDHCRQIYNRERWRVAEVDVEARTVVLDGVDTARRVSVDSAYLKEVTKDGAPALQHAYAATAYQAQGSTVDRAYVMVDPSMDKRRSTWPPRAAARRPSSTPRRRSRASGRRSRRAPAAARALSTSPAQLNATAPRPPPTTRRCALVSPASRPGS